MIKFYFLRKVVILLLVVSCGHAWAQSRTVTGKVTSGDDGSPLPGVSIVEKGTSNGTVTDADGNFSINTKDNAVLVFSFVGFTGQEVIVGAQNNLQVTMQSDVTALDEIVVIGYGEIQKKDLTGAVENIGSRDFNRGVMTNPQDLIVGKLAGVQVITNNGAPGSGTTIRIRGGASLTATNDPLIVIDGFPVDNSGVTGISNQLSAINPNDIETFTVLKDASATAIYGSRASNGVIIITTKKGAAGKMAISYNGTVSASTPAKFVDVMDADEFRAVAEELAANGQAGLDAAALDKLGDANTDWQREIFETAISHDHNLSASGAVENFPYRVSYGYTDQKGILKTTGFKRHSLNLNLTPSFLDGDLKFNVSAKASHNVSDFGDAGAVGNAVSFDPTQPVRTDNSQYGGYFSWLGLGVTNGNSNPVAMLEQTDNQGTAQRIILSGQVDYKLPFAKGLTATLNLGTDRASSEGYNRSPIEAGFLHNAGTLIGRDNTYSSGATSSLLDFYVNYLRETGSHRVDLTAGYGWQHFTREEESDNANEVETSEFSSESENFLISFFGRLNYSYKSRILLTATLREDGSSRFSEENRWGFFPSAALAWRLKNESFMEAVNAVSDLKLRVGFGVTGQQDIPGQYYPYMAIYRSSNDQAQYQLGSAFYRTVRPEPYDANIKWEETTTINAGIDFGFLEDRITGSVEVYKKDTKDLLNRIAIANGVNFSNFLTTNVGSMENKGFEFTLNAKPIMRSDLLWSIGLNLTTIDSKITKLNLTDDPTYPGVREGNIGVDQFIQNHQVGFPAYSFHVYQQVYDEAGKPIEGVFVDRSGQGGTVFGNEANRYRFQRPAPDFLIGLNSRVEYNHFDFSFSSRLSIGNYVYNNVEAGGSFYNNVYQLQHFRNIQRNITDTDFMNQQQLSDYYIQDASFFKLDNASIGYNFENLMSEKLKARLSFTVQNAFVITDYKGIDPELSNGIDNNIYPRPRTFLLGVNLTF